MTTEIDTLGIFIQGYQPVSYYANPDRPQTFRMSKQLNVKNRVALMCNGEEEGTRADLSLSHDDLRLIRQWIDQELNDAHERP